VNPILVPAPPRSAYNPNRRVSDLLLSQVRHFQHIELKRGDVGIPADVARDVYTEGGAARYIAALTKALRGKPAAPAAAAQPKPAKPTNIAVLPQPKQSPAATQGLELAAVATPGPSSQAASPSKKKSAPKKTTPKKPRSKK
jgi:hypothetical protein